MALKGKTALVTGSTSGIGLGIARALAASGADIVLNGFGDRAAIDTLLADLKAEYKVNVGYSAADMEACQVAAMISQAKRVDILVNNAGIHTAPVEEFPAERWDAVIAINLSAAFHAIRAALPQMKSRNWGASSTSPRPRPGCLGAEGGLRRGQARPARPDKGRGPRDGPRTSPAMRSARAGF